MAHHLRRARLTAASPPRGPGTKHSHWDAILKWPFRLFLITDCGGVAVSPRRFHTPIRSLPHSRESPSIDSSLTFEGHISRSCGADIHWVHSFLTGTRRLILSAAAWGIHPPPCMGIDASIFLSGGTPFWSIIWLKYPFSGRGNSDFPGWKWRFAFLCLSEKF